MVKTTLDFTRPHVLRNDEELAAAIEEIDRLLDADAKPGSPEDELLDFLTVLVKAYEDEHYPFQGTTAQEIVDFALEQHDLKRADLAATMGGRSRVSDFFAGKRTLSKRQAKALRDRFGIPLEVLI